MGALNAKMRTWDCVLQTKGSHIHITWAEQRGIVAGEIRVAIIQRRE